MSINILGVRIDTCAPLDLLGQLQTWLVGTKQHWVVTPNPEMLMAAHRDPEFCTILNQSSLSVPDGIGVVWAGWWTNRRKLHRIAGVDLAEQLISRLAHTGISVFFLGGDPGVAGAAAQHLAKRYVGLRVAGFLDGGVVTAGGTVQPDILDRIRQAQPALLVVAFGHGKQERFIHTYVPELPTVRVAIGVGGAFDFWAGRVVRAPKIFQMLGLEWLYRLTKQPKRIRRILRAVIIFPCLILSSRFRYAHRHHAIFT